MNSDDFNRPFVGFYDTSLAVERTFKAAKYKEHHGSYAEKRMDTALAPAAVGIVLFNGAYSFVMVGV